MPYLVDYHTHTAHSADALGSINELVEAGARAGLTHMAVTEHVDFVPADPSCGFFKADKYSSDMREVAGKYPLELAMGMELGIEPECLHEAVSVQSLPVYREMDFVIGSVHAVGDCLLGARYFADRNRRQAFQDYLQSVKQAVLSIGRSGLIDVVGHLDVVKRYAPPGFADGWLLESMDCVDDVLKAIVSAGVGLEINVSGFRQTPREQYPSLPILELYRKLSGEVLTIGSDSHTAANLTREAPRLLEGQEVARQAGFKYITVFKDRKPQFLSIT